MVIPSHPRVVVWRRRFGRWLPRLLALVWAAWCVVTAAAYVHHVPEQLQAVDGAVKAPVWTVWAAAALLLTLGTLAPSTASPKAKDISRWLRIIGMSIAAAMLIMWTTAFCVADPRGWVSGKNYALLALMALYTTWTIARDSAARGEP